MKLEVKRRDNYVSLFFNWKIPFVQKTFRFHTKLYASPNAWVHGYSSRTETGQYVLFHDYDNLDKKSIVNELKYLQKKYGLGDYYLFKLDREDSFHAVNLDVFPIVRAYEIQQNTSCDQAFIHAIKNLQTREWVLRWGIKGLRDCPKFDSVIYSRGNKRVRSTAHGAFLTKLGVPLDLNKGRWDGNKLLTFVDYDTANRIK